MWDFLFHPRHWSPRMSRTQTTDQPPRDDCADDAIARQRGPREGRWSVWSGAAGKKVIDRRLGSPTHNVWSRFFEQRKMCVITTRYRCRFCLKKMYTFWGKREKCRSISFSYAQNKKSRSDATPDLSDFQQFDFWPRDDRVWVLQIVAKRTKNEFNKNVSRVRMSRQFFFPWTFFF